MHRRPATASILSRVGRALLESNLPTEAKECFERAAELDRADRTVLHGLATIAVASGKNPTAIDYYRRVVEIYPGDSDALRALGLLHLKQGQKAAATDYFERVLELLPLDPIATSEISKLKI